LTVRVATESDIPKLVEMGRAFHAYSADVEAGFDAEGAASFLTVLIASPDAYVAVDGSRAFVGMMVSYPHLDKAWRTANEIYWWAETPGGDLLSAFEEWGRAKGARKFIMSHRHDNRHAALARLMKMSGYIPHEYYYIKVV